MSQAYLGYPCVSYLYQHTHFRGGNLHRNGWQLSNGVGGSRSTGIGGNPWTGILKLLAKLGKGAFLETLLLKEDVSPHVHFFTSKGLIQLFQRKGFALESKFKFAEVGAELAERNRGPIGISSMLMRISGVLLEFISPWWADTSVFLFRRDDQADYV